MQIKVRIPYDHWYSAFCVVMFLSVNTSSFSARGMSESVGVVDSVFSREKRWAK